MKTIQNIRMAKRILPCSFSSFWLEKVENRLEIELWRTYHNCNPKLSLLAKNISNQLQYSNLQSYTFDFL